MWYFLLSSLYCSVLLYVGTDSLCYLTCRVMNVPTFTSSLPFSVTPFPSLSISLSLNLSASLFLSFYPYSIPLFLFFYPNPLSTYVNFLSSSLLHTHTHEHSIYLSIHPSIYLPVSLTHRSTFLVLFLSLPLSYITHILYVSLPRWCTIQSPVRVL